MLEQISIWEWLSTLDSSCGKMLLDACLAENQKEKISESSLKKSAKSQTVMPLFLDLRNGVRQDASWEMGGLLLGEYQTISFGEHPNVDVECALSEILVGGAHPKYFLSAKACQGILNRAKNKKKDLPDILKEALLTQIERERERESKCIGNGQVNQGFMSDCVGALNCMHDQQAVAIVEKQHNKNTVSYGMNKAFLDQGVNAKGTLNLEKEKIGAQVASGVVGVFITER